MTTNERLCLCCEKPLVRRAGERHWYTRKFCNPDCSAGYRTKVTLAKRTNTKACACGCGAVLVQKDYETPHKWAIRRFASQACFHRSMMIPDELRQKKACGCCGKLFPKPANHTVAMWEARRYCSQRCHIAAQKQSGAQFIERMREHAAQREAERPTKVCQCCGIVFKRPVGIKKLEWEKRQFCSTLCGNRTKLKNIRATKSEIQEAQKRARRQKMIADAIANAKPERVIGRFQSVEEFLAAGGQVTRCPTVAVAPTAGIEIAERDRQIIAARYASQEAKFDNRPRVFG